MKSRKESLQHFKEPWAHDHEPIRNLLDAVKSIKPTVLIGSSGVGQTFTKEVVEAMSSFNEVIAVSQLYLHLHLHLYLFDEADIGVYNDMQKPVILALSNPTSQSECTAEQAYSWSNVRYTNSTLYL